MGGQASRDNGKKGGRRKGGKNDVAAADVRQRIVDASLAIVAAQIAAAVGTVQLYRQVRGQTVRVESEDTIFRFLNGELEGQGYTLAAAIDPDTRACDALLNRAFGKPKETVALDAEGGLLDLLRSLQ